MKVQTLLEIIQAAHLTVYVESPYKQRGGIMFVAPPGHLKTTILESSLGGYPDVLSLSDLNVQTLGMLRDAIMGGDVKTLTFGEYEKLYQRKSSTASNLEGYLKALCEEGFRTLSFEDPRIPGTKARALVIGAMTPSFFKMHYTEWQSNGFARRFLWCHFSLIDSDVLLQAIEHNELYNIGDLALKKIPATRSIKFISDPHFQFFLKGQPGRHTPLVLLKKLYSVLCWKHNDPKIALAIMKDFRECLTNDGAQIRLEEK